MVLERAWRGVAVIYASSNGLPTAKRIEDQLKMREIPCLLLKYEQADLDKLWDCVDYFIFVMAVGGAVRAACAHAKGKDLDPLILVVDDAGRYVVPILGSHWGANEGAKELSSMLGATAVITTAAEQIGYTSVEEIAAATLSKIVDLKAAIKVNGAIVRGEEVCVDVPNLHMEDLRGNFRYGRGCSYAIVFGEEEEQENVVRLKPLMLSVGVGAKEEAEVQLIEEAILHFLERLKVDVSRVGVISSVRSRVKDVADHFGVKFMGFSFDELKGFRYGCLTPPSQKLIELGIGGVAEVCALLAGGEKSRLVLRKTPYMREVTVAIASYEG
jgi:cobalt-precorrin 5A hydrolase